MSDYRKDETGEPTTADDPGRSLWYSAGRCGYWTDDWSKLKTLPGGRPSLLRHGIPCCPNCESPGFQTTGRQWWDGAKKYDELNRDYLAFVQQSKEQCAGRDGPSFLERYREFARSSDAKEVKGDE